MSAYPCIEYALDQGMELQVTKLLSGEIFARVWTGTLQGSYHGSGSTITGALEALEHLLSKVGPKP